MNHEKAYNRALLDGAQTIVTHESVTKKKKLPSFDSNLLNQYQFSGKSTDTRDLVREGLGSCTVKFLKEEGISDKTLLLTDPIADFGNRHALQNVSNPTLTRNEPALEVLKTHLTLTTP